MIGQSVSHYKILGKIGAGGMGVVYKAWDNKLERPVALKFLHGDLTRDDSAKKRLVHEARAISRLQHRNICTIHEIDETPGGDVFIAFDYYEGETLKTRLERGALPVDEAVDFTLQVARGLEEAHRHHIIHRDVKPGNIIVTHGEAKIMDFGLARLSGQSRLTQTDSIVGTTAYLSPEQVLGETLDSRSDIFSLGSTFYELLTGRTPFEAEHTAATLYRIMNQPPPRLSELGVPRAADLDPVVAKMLAKDREQRYPTVTDVIDDLSHLGTMKKTRARRARPRRTAAIVGAAAVLVVLTTLAVTRPWRRPGGGAESRTSIAVLPFRNLSADSLHAYFASGLHDELLTQLAKVASLKVISRTSVMGYADGNTPLKQIASELNVGSVVEGTVQVAGERLRVNIQLVDASTDGHLWAESYDRTLDDAFAIQSDVAQRVVEAVGAKLGAAEQELITTTPTANSDAYQFYLQAREYANRPGYHRHDFENAQQLYERALALDPSFVLAHAGVSHIHGLMYWFRYDGSQERLQRQWDEASTALELGPNVPQAHVAMGFAHAVRGDRRLAIVEYETASKSLPNSLDVWKRIAAVHRRLGNWEECSRAYEQAARLDPRDPDLHWDLGGMTYRTTRRYEDAVRAFDRALALAPDLYVADVSRAWVFVEWRGDLDSLRAVLQRIPVDASLGHLGSARAQRAELLLWERQPKDLLSLLAATPERVLEGQGFYYPVALYAAWAHRLEGNETAARTSLESALALLDSAAATSPDDERIRTARGLVLGGLGRTGDAMKEAEWMAQSPVYREDRYDGPIDAQKRARILAQSGAADAALDEIERLLPGPSLLTGDVLMLDPLFDPIREHPRFATLIATYNTP